MQTCAQPNKHNALTNLMNPLYTTYSMQDISTLKNTLEWDHWQAVLPD